MSIVTRNLKQDITHWTVTSDGFGGFTYSTPVTQKGRWEDSQILFRNAEGEEVVSDAIVYLSSDVVVEDFLFDGISVVADPTTLAEAKQIRQFNKTPDLRNNNEMRKAFL